MKKLQVNCGDWHLGWGLSGNDKIGKLSLTEDGNFLWKGKSQGRHGQVWNKGASIEFKITDGMIERISQKGGAPCESELMKSVDELTLLLSKRK